MGTKGDLVFGRVVDISKPFRFDAKSILHAGYVRSDSDSSKRIILVALCADTARTLNAQLLNLGFNPVKIRKRATLACDAHGSLVVIPWAVSSSRHLKRSRTP